MDPVFSSSLKISRPLENRKIKEEKTKAIIMLLQKSYLCKYHMKYYPSYNKNDTRWHRGRRQERLVRCSIASFWGEGN